LHVSQLKIFDQNKKLWLLASTDPLTGCLNRRTFFEKAERAFKSAINQRELISFIMVDADHFKRVNDRFGHGVGDEVLVGLADVLKSSCCARDSVGRYGGEEFCMAVVGRTEDDVVRLAEHIRREIGEVRTLLPNGERVTISIGIASQMPDSGELADLVKRADEALYAAKNAGRNRVVSWTKTRSPDEEFRLGQLAGGLDTHKGSERLAAR
jgi:diguanylate cyclase (GGDEF)-like protein